MVKFMSWTLTLVVAAVFTSACGSGQAIEWQKTENAIVLDSPSVPTCADLGKGAFSFTVKPVTDGSHAIDATNSVDLTTFSGTWFNWVSNLSMGAVIVPGGTGAKVYLYEGEVTANAGLSGPIDAATGQPYPLTELIFCYDLGLKVSLDVLAKAKRIKKWELKKSVKDSTLTLSEGQTFLAQYTVAVSQTSISESDWSAVGTVTVSNPTASAATVTDVTNVMDGSTNVPLTCPVAFPAPLQPGASFTCTYSVGLTDGSTRTLEATATTSGSVSGGSHQRNIDFTYASYNYLDSCVTVTDSLYGYLGQVCYNDAPKTFSYVMAIGPYKACGKYQVVNTAKLVTDSTGAILTSSATVDIDVPCGGGCTLTPGYWKTHSSYGPAPYDSTWASLPAGADTTFFLSGQSYYDVLWTAPKGDAYYILAHAFIAAQLNLINGASMPAAVTTEYQAALALLQTTAPGVDRKAKNPFISAATALDDYNNGITGPGHCSE